MNSKKNTYGNIRMPAWPLLILFAELCLLPLRLVARWLTQADRRCTKWR